MELTIESRLLFGMAQLIRGLVLQIEQPLAAVAALVQDSAQSLRADTED